jgi:hypothetical protein
LNPETKENDMATQTKTQDLYDLDGATERWTEATRKAGNDYLDAYGKTVDQLADYGVKAAAATKLPVVTELAESQAKLSRNLTETYVTVTRDLLKA